MMILMIPPRHLSAIPRSQELQETPRLPWLQETENWDCESCLLWMTREHISLSTRLTDNNSVLLNTFCQIKIIESDRSQFVSPLLIYKMKWMSIIMNVWDPNKLMPYNSKSRDEWVNEHLFSFLYQIIHEDIPYQPLIFSSCLVSCVYWLDDLEKRHQNKPLCNQSC